MAYIAGLSEASLSPNIRKRLTNKNIKRTSDSITELDGKSTVVDASNISKFQDNTYIDKLADMCAELKEYKAKEIRIPVSKWNMISDEPDILKSKTPIGAICRYLKSNPALFKKKFAGFTFIFYNAQKESFALLVDKYSAAEYVTFENLLKVLLTPHVTHNLTGGVSDKKSPVKDVVDKKTQEKEQVEKKKQELVDAVAQAAEDSSSEAEAWEKLDSNEHIRELIAELEEEDDGKPKFNAARTSRIAKLNDELLDKDINGRTVKDIIDGGKKSEELPPAHLKVASINEEWDDVRFANFQNVYDINADIFSILQSLSTKSYPVSIVDVKVEDTSNNMDYIDTYTVEMEDGFGKRFTLVFDIPKFKNNRFMRLRGNEKIMSGQLLLLPCLKTDEDTVQCVSNYNKIFIRRHGLTGRSYPSSDRLVKALRKYNGSKMKIYYGDNKAICSKYELPADYIDVASQVNRIEIDHLVFYFNQDIYYKEFKADPSKGIPFAVNKDDGMIWYYDNEYYHGDLITFIIASIISDREEKFKDIYESQKSASRLNYSEASILANRIPLVVVLGYSLGLSGVFKLLKIDMEDSSKRMSYNPDREGVIRFSDGYIKYKLNYSTSMLLNGLSECPTEAYSVNDINKRSMWLDFLDEFGGRILSDGLDNFADLFIDPITEDICKRCKIPSDYFQMLVYASNLLVDNKYNRHTDITGNRYRTNEIVAGYFYKAISKAYTDYKIQVKRGRRVGMTMKRSAVIDGIMQDPMSSDLSIMNPLLEIEAANTVSFKGLSGMNSDRSYGLDKRTYDDSMINKLALSTGFAANVGINRQTTIDMDIEGKRGYIKQSKQDDMSVTKTFSMSEAVTPFGTTRDDPFRSAMTFIQTSKHSMRTSRSSPLLVTNGADEAMPYLVSDTFAFKAKEDGEVIEIVDDDHMIIKYKRNIVTTDNKAYDTECISLKNEVKKNSDGGFFITLKLDTDLAVGAKFKKGDIVAYDRSSFSSSRGEDDNLAFNLGVLAKVAILNTDEGFEDSTSVSNWLSEAMATDVVVEKDKDLSKNTNLYYLVKVGQEVQEGDPLMIFQNSFDENDANLLLKNITDPEYVSDLGRVKLKSKYTGVIQDIKIYRTCEISEMSESLARVVTSYEKKIKAQKAMYKKYNMPGANLLDPDYKMEATGKMKNNPDGVKIVIYIKYGDMLSVGDKVVAQSANKGVVKNIFPVGLEPFSEYRPEEKIHALFAARSFNARMVTSVWVSGAINKCMIELDRHVKEIMGLEWDKLEDIL